MNIHFVSHGYCISEEIGQDFASDLVLNECEDESQVQCSLRICGPIHKEGFVLTFYHTSSGYSPHCLVCNENPFLLLTFDKSLVRLDLHNKSIEFIKEMIWYISDILSVPFQKRAIVFYEVGAMAIDYDGNTLWDVWTDIIIEYKVREEKTLIIKTIEQEEVWVDLKTGLETRFKP